MATNEIHTPLTQRAGALSFAANGTPLQCAPTERAEAPSSTLVALAVVSAKATATESGKAPPPATCQQCITISVFFDGTGNNLDADIGTLQHSNVARLYQSHRLDDPVTGRYSFYVPGLGTYFKDIGDPGHDKFGLAFGRYGQDRLDWAFKKFDEKVKAAEARALNPTNKIRFIQLNVFGFSRGATAARAFVRDMERRCTPRDGQYCLKSGGHPIEVNFLGLFDTVASVGIPMSGNNMAPASSLSIYRLRTTLGMRDITIAFGPPGADPAPGSHDGHSSWADGLRIPAPGFVKNCVHMVAAHEIRNSFPLDSVLDGTRYPSGVVELVYPGVHSDVGGGYQPGEGARGMTAGQQLSLIPLRVMHERARRAGVPLRALTEIMSDGTGIERKSFALDDQSTKEFAEMTRLFRSYMAKAGGGRAIGDEFLAHSSWWLRWRFFNIRRNEQAAGAGRAGPDRQTIAEREPGFAADRARQKGVVDDHRKDLAAASRDAAGAQDRYRIAAAGQARTGIPINPGLIRARDDALDRESRARDAFLREQAKLDTAADDSALQDSLALYDERLVQDAQGIVAYHRANPALVLRPHYRNLVEAYQAQYLRGDPLDADVAAFFDRYVHDSLGGFAQDATLPSDPRVIYAGGNNKIRFAMRASDAGDAVAA